MMWLWFKAGVVAISLIIVVGVALIFGLMLFSGTKGPSIEPHVGTIYTKNTEKSNDNKAVCNCK